MSRGARIGLLALAVAVLVAGFLIARPDEEQGAAPGRQPAGGESGGGSGQAQPASPPAFTVRVRNGGPAGGEPRRLTVEQDERVRITVRSDDTTDTAHLHGYDVERELAPGRPARFSLTAKDTGIFELELHHSQQTIAELRVQP